MDKVHESKRWASKSDYYKATRVFPGWGGAKTNPLCIIVSEYVCGLFPPKREDIMQGIPSGRVKLWESGRRSGRLESYRAQERLIGPQNDVMWIEHNGEIIKLVGGKPSPVVNEKAPKTEDE